MDKNCLNFMQFLETFLKLYALEGCDEMSD